MANVRAFRSGNWSDTNPATSPWGTGGVLYAPAAGDDVYSNTYTIHVDQNVTVNSVTNNSATSRLWKDGATTTATAGGTFNLLNGIIFVAGTITPVTTLITLSGTNSASIVGNAAPSTATASNRYVVLHSSTGTLNFTGNIDNSGSAGGNSADNGAQGIRITAPGILNYTGNIFAGRQTGNHGICNASTGRVFFTGNVYGLGFGLLTDNPSTSFGIHNRSIGDAIVVGNVFGGLANSSGAVNESTGNFTILGNVIASSIANAFVSSNANAINKISGNIINNSNGTAAIYAARYVVDPVPTNSVIQYSNVNMFTTDSLSAFSMPPVSAVRSGVSFANNTLTGTCKVPSANSVNIGVPVDNTVGTAFLNSAMLFDTSVASLTASDSLGARLKNSATVQSVGNIITSFSN